MTTGVIVINFGEPPDLDRESVVQFLERIFVASGLGSHVDPDALREHAHGLAERRAPGLLEEYARIGGSPLNGQADDQARRLEEELRARGHDVKTYSGFQFTSPFVEEVVGRARSDGIARVVGLPVYPMCGHSTTVAALQQLRDAVAAEDGWDPDVFELSGWHRHPDFYALHVDRIRDFADREGIDPLAPDTAFLFSIHGTPIKYLEQGNRYDRYVEEACEGIASRLGLERYHLGYQNHTNRPIEWTQPDVEAVVKELNATRVVVMPLAFMHEQSETLVELDHELREEAEEEGLIFHRVPVPHDAPRFVSILADLVEAALGQEPGVSRVQLRRCLCRRGGTALCTSGLRLESTVVPAREAERRA
jgi:ferrochelatase